MPLLKTPLELVPGREERRGGPVWLLIGADSVGVNWWCSTMELASGGESGRLPRPPAKLMLLLDILLYLGKN